MRGARAQEDANSIAHRKVGQTFMQNLDSSQIENEGEEERWQVEDQMAALWDEERKLEEFLERRWIEGSSLNLDAMQEVLELVVNERTSQGKRVESPKDKTKVPGRSVEEMKEKPNITVEEDTEEMRKWRGLSQSEMDQCWWHSADRMEEEVLDKYKVEECKREAFGGRGDTFGKEESAQKQEIQTKKVVRRLLGQNFLFVWRIQFAASAQHARGFDGRW